MIGKTVKEVCMEEYERRTGDVEEQTYEPKVDGSVYTAYTGEVGKGSIYAYGNHSVRGDVVSNNGIFESSGAQTSSYSYPKSSVSERVSSFKLCSKKLMLESFFLHRISLLRLIPS